VKWRSGGQLYNMHYRHGAGIREKARGFVAFNRVLNFINTQLHLYVDSRRVGKRRWAAVFW
jgi:hypothetical protein